MFLPYLSKYYNQSMIGKSKGEASYSLLTSRLTEKDLQLFKKTYRKLTELYYENSKRQMAVSDLICMGNLLIEAISTQQQSQALSVLSILQILKVKAKQSSELVRNVQTVILHLKQPKSNSIKYQTILHALQKNELFVVGCTAAIRYYHDIVSNNTEFDWKSIISELGRNIPIDPTICIDLMYQICKQNEHYSKLAVKSGLIKYIFMSYINKSIENKFNLYSSIRLIKVIASSERTILREREKSIAFIISKHDDYIPIITQICKKCYDFDYCLESLQKGAINIDYIDFSYIWSLVEYFCTKNLTQQDINTLVGLLNKQCTPQIQMKIYSILSYYTKYNKLIIKNVYKTNPTFEISLLNFIKLCLNSEQISHEISNYIDLKGLQKKVQESSNAKVHQLFKILKQLCTNKEVKVGSLKNLVKSSLSIEQNADYMMQRASKIPLNNQQLNDIKKILMQKQGKSEFQSDTIKSIKSNALNSLQKAIIMKTKFDLNIITDHMELNSVELVAKVMQLLELYLLMNYEEVDKINAKRILQMIQWIENNYDGQIIDWGSIGQILLIICEQDEWKKHVKQIPLKCYWILSIGQIGEEQETLIQNQVKMISNNFEKYKNKIPLMVGFLGKIFQSYQKLQLIDNHKQLVDLMIKNCKNNNNYKTNVLMLSFFIKNWFSPDQDQDNLKNNNDFQKIIAAIVNVVLNNFRSLEQEYLLLESSLPFRFKIDSISDNLEHLISLYGKLASYIYQINQNNQNGKKKYQISYDKISSISNFSETQNSSILQILNFLEDNNEIIQSNQLERLTQNLLNRKYSYWQLYPNFMNIIQKIIKILAKTENNNIKESISAILINFLSNSTENDNISEEQVIKMQKSIKQCLQKLQVKGVYIEIEKLKKTVNKVVNKEIKQQIIIILNNYQIKQDKKKKNNLSNQNGKPFEKKMLQEPFISQASSSQILSNHQLKNWQTQKLLNLQSPQIQSSNTNKGEFIDSNYHSTSKKNNASGLLLSESKLVFPDQGLNENRQQLQKHENINVQDQILNLQKQKDNRKYDDGISVLEALRKLKKIVDKHVPVDEFQGLINIFMKNELSSKEKDILGHLLTKLYFHFASPHILQLLLLKNKTSLSKDSCFQLLSNFKQTFILAQRWKLLSRNWLDLAMIRLYEGFYADACQVAEYNLIKLSDIEYFYEKGYHGMIVNMIGSALKVEDAIYLLLLIGTSARLPKIKQYYLLGKVHLRISNFQYQYPENTKIIANLSYALSALVYMEQQICTQICQQKQFIGKLFQSYRKNARNKPVIESGACLIANLAYSNDTAKQLLRTKKVTEILTYFFNQNLQNPQLSTFKQLLRAFGNLSLSKKCTQQIIDNNFCASALKMVENLQILVHFDDKKAKIVKILIDLIANLAAHKYKLQLIHKEKITLLILTLLETTETNPQILMGCIDTIDGLCQNPQIQKYVVTEKNLSFILIDVLKIQQDEKIVIKSTRLLTNLTLNSVCIPYILEANLLSVLANIVMPYFQGKHKQKDNIQRMQTYIVKIISRIYQSQQPQSLILKSGYLDCVVRTLETSDKIQQIFLDILHYYSQSLPSFLNKRTFMCLIRVLSKNMQNKQNISKCLKILKNLLVFSYDRDEQNLVIEGIGQMYQRLLGTQYRDDVLYLLSYHLLRSYKLREILRNKVGNNVIQVIQHFMNTESVSQLCKSLIFLIHNPQTHLHLDQNVQNEEKYYNILRAGIQCRLFRVDGSSKKAIIDMDQEYNIRAYKYPDGEIKKKYCMNIRYIKDFQVDYTTCNDLWNLSTFNLEKKGFFQTKKSDSRNCCTIVGSAKWGEVFFINLEFDNPEQKMLFFNALSNLIFAFRS